MPIWIRFRSISCMILYLPQASVMDEEGRYGILIYSSLDGFTYERQSLLDHFARNGHVDPITGRPCKESDLVPNRSLKEAIEDFLKENGWAAGKLSQG